MHQGVGVASDFADFCSAMCKHILNAQASIRAACCKQWYDCTQCHEDSADHPLFRTRELVVGCKKCRRVFKKDLSEELEDADEYCPHCDNQFVIEAREPAPAIDVLPAAAAVECGALDARMRPSSRCAVTEEDLAILLAE